MHERYERARSLTDAHRHTYAASLQAGRGIHVRWEMCVRGRKAARGKENERERGMWRTRYIQLYVSRNTVCVFGVIYIRMRTCII